MAKPPAFQFYAMDFMNGTKYMTLPERGAYITLLCEQWDQGSVPGVEHQVEFTRLLGCGKKEAERVWLTLSGKFERGDDGRYRNPRLERERIKQGDYKELLAKRAKAGAEARWKKPKDATGTDEAMLKQSLSNAGPSNASLSSSLSSSSSTTPPKNGGAVPRAKRLVRPVTEWPHGEHEGGGFCDWMCLPAELVDQFAQRLALTRGTSAREERPNIVAWANRVMASGIVPTGRMFDFWNAQWERAHGSSRVVQDGAAGKHARSQAAIDRFVENG